MELSAFSALSPKRPQFWQVAKRCCIIAASIDVAFFFIFLILDSPILAWINLLSIAMYLTAYWAFGQRKNMLAISLIWLEVLYHSALGTLMIGWDSGFHYFLLMFVPAIFVSMSLKPAVLTLLGLWVYYLSLDLFSWYYPAIQPINATASVGVHIFNLTVVFMMFGYLALYYLNKVNLTHDQLRFYATTDPLTKLRNRRHMSELLKRALQNKHAEQRNVSVLLLDLDHFKSVNDTHGHEVGDKVLRITADILRDTVRDHDKVSRWGGEEFLVFLPRTNLNHAAQVAERIRKAIAKYPWHTVINENIQLTTSIGVSELKPDDSVNTLVKRADDALYRSKEAGRNWVELESEASCRKPKTASSSPSD